jgi:hypothetical protein
MIDMHVYVLVYFDDDSDTVLGVYSTFELAYNYAKEHYPNYYYKIERHEIDKIQNINRD